MRLPTSDEILPHITLVCLLLSIIVLLFRPIYSFMSIKTKKLSVYCTLTFCLSLKLNNSNASQMVPKITSAPPPWHSLGTVTTNFSCSRGRPHNSRFKQIVCHSFTNFCNSVNPPFTLSHKSEPTLVTFYKTSTLKLVSNDNEMPRMVCSSHLKAFSSTMSYSHVFCSSEQIQAY